MTMVNLPKVYGLIVAAGRGSRFASDIPKQYLQIDNRTIVEHSISKLKQSDYINHCYLVISEHDDIARTIDWQMSINFCIGGAERWESVQAGVSAISEVADPDDLILVHDAARPCVQVDDINRVVGAAMQEKYGAMLATPVVDTIKRVSDSSYSEMTVLRNNLWKAQTPQVFRLGYLQKALEHVQESKQHITDEVNAFEQLGFPIKVIQGSSLNMKLTYPDDLLLLQAILEIDSMK